MQDPQSYEDDAGNVYVREGNRYRVIRAGQAPSAPAASPQGPPGLIPMVTPAEQRAREEREYDRQRDEQRDQLTASREERAIAAAARQAEAAQRAADLAERTARGGTPEMRGRLMFGLPSATRAEQRIQSMEEGGQAPLNRDWGAAVIDAIPDFGLLNVGARLAGGDDYQAYDQATASIEAALMPIFSGLAVTDSEARRFIRANQPRLGDSPATLEEKSRNRSEVINAGAQIMGRPLPFPDVGIYGVAGAEPTAQADNGELRVRDLNPDETPEALAASGRIRGSDGVWRYPRDEQGNPIFPEDAPGGGQPPAGSGGGGDGGQSPAGGGDNGGLQRSVASAEIRDGAQNQRSRPGIAGQIGATDRGFGRRADAFVRGIADTVTFGTADEIAAGLDTIIPATPGSRSGWTDGFGEAYRQNVAQQRGIDTADRTDLPVTRVAGQVTGGFVPGAGVARAAVGGTRLARAGRAAGAGAAIGGAYGFGSGEGNALERIPDAAAGAGIGAALGPIAAPAANALNRGVIQPAARGLQAVNRAIARPVVNALGEAAPAGLREAVAVNPLRSGVNRFADRMGAERVNALNPNLATARNNGLDQADLIDVLDDGSIGRMRALGTRDTPGRDVAVASAEARRRNLPSRTARIASEEISPDSRPALQAIDDLRATRRQNASAIDSFGADEVPLSRDAILALRSDFVRPHIQAAARRAQGSTDPVEREAAARLNRLAEMALDDPAAARLTVREAQDISKALNDAATAAFRNNPADGQALANLGRTVRDTARDNSTGYASWLRKYGDDSDLIESAATGRNFVSVSRDPANARGTEAFVRRAEGAGPADLQIQRTAAREAVETAASNPSGARTVLEGFANDTGQARRATAIGVDAGRLQDRAGAELDSVTRHQRASPRIGSETSTNAQDSLEAAGSIVGAVGDVLTGQFGRAGGRVVTMVKGRGFSNHEAEAIITAANDPQQTDRLISMLAERMSRREARSLARAIRYQLTTGPQSGRQQ